MNCQQTARFLRERDNYLILTHKRPDGDTIGCAAGLLELLRGMGKTAWLLENRDATPLFHEYLEGRSAPADFQPDTVVCVDVATAELLPPNAGPYLDRIDLAIDHHPSHTFFARESWLETDRAACGELVYELAVELGGLSQAVATPLYVAVSTDTGCFVYSNTSPNTHRVAADLMAAGAPYRRLNKKHFRTKTMARMRLEGLILQHLELYHDGTVAVAPISLEMMAQAQAGEQDAEDIAAFVGVIEGVRHSVTIRELRPGECKISLRTASDLLDASATCARLGGGGHRAAAGCTVHGSVGQAQQAILEAIDTQLQSEAVSEG